VDLNTQSLARLTTAIELTNGTSYGEIYRNGNDIRAAIEQWNAGVLPVQEDTPLDVSGAVVSVQENTPLDVSGAVVNVQEDTPLDVSAATVTVDDSGDFAISSLPSIPAGSNNIGSVNLDGQPIDVSAATVSVQEATPLDVSAATVTVDQSSTVAIQEDTPLDVSGATVTVDQASTLAVQESTALDVSAATVPTEQQTPLQLEDSTGTNIDPASDPAIKGGASLQVIVDAVSEAALAIVGDADTAYEKGTSVGSGGSTSASLKNRGAEALSGGVTRATTSYDVDVEWKDDDGNVRFTESVASGATAGTLTTLDLPARAPRVNVVVSDAGSGSGAVDATYHLR
jgi:hypothetical protein